MSFLLILIRQLFLFALRTKSVTDVHRAKLKNEKYNLVNNFQFLGITIDNNLSFSIATIKV